jgi:signal peptidase I
MSEPRYSDPVKPENSETYEPPKVSLLREYYETVLVCVLFILYTWTFVVMQSKIPTASMQDTLLIGDRIIVNKFAYGTETWPWLKMLFPYHDIRRGDVVVFKSLEDPEKDFIKRVIAVGGDRLEMVNKRAYLNGAPLDESYVQFGDSRVYGVRDLRSPYGHPRDNFGPIVIPDGHYFVMGDNRDNSNDSRAFGPVERRYVKGKAVLIFWSMEQPGQWSDPLGKKAWNVLKSAANFFRWTRWDRIFRPVE